MNNVEKISLDEVVARSNNYDLFLCCASFEDRCKAISSQLSQSYAGKVMICHYHGSNHKSDENFKEIAQLFPGNNQEVILNKNCPLQNYDSLYDAILSSGCSKILVDISTLTRETLLILLVLLRQKPFESITVTLCYVPAAAYSNGDSCQSSRIWLSKGVHNIRTVLGYPGFMSPSKETLLIVLVGFETERASILINRFEADKLYLGYAPPVKSHSEEFAKINRESFDHLASSFSGSNIFEFSCIDIDHTKSVIKGIIESKMDKYNIIISPMNNKLSTIAVGMVAFEYPEVQISYASTNLYNTEAYSSPANYAYMVDFGQTNCKRIG